LTRWVFPKELVLAVACALIALVAGKGRLPIWFWSIIAAGSVVLISAALSGEAPLAQFLGRWPRYEGLITLSVYVAASWFGARALGPLASESRLGVFRNAVSVAAVVLGAVSVAEALGARPIPSDLDRPGALLGNATDQGVVGVMFFAILIVPAARFWLTPIATRGFSVMPAAGSIAALVTVVASASRTALVSLLITILGLGLLELIRARRFRGRTALVTLGLVVVSGLLILGSPLAASRVSGASPLAGSTIADRLINWQATVALVAGHPLAGVGPSGFIDAITPKLGPDWYAIVSPGSILDSPHSWPLQALAAGGVPLGILAISAACGVAAVGIRRWRATVVAKLSSRADHLTGVGLATLGFSVALLTHFTSPGTTILASLLIGSLISLPPKPRPLNIGVEAGRYSRVLLLFAGIGILVAFCAGEVELQDGTSSVNAGKISEGEQSFSAALALRAWDSDAAGIASQVFAAAADRGVSSAAPLAVTWANRSLASTPRSISSLNALAVGQQYTGDFAGAKSTLQTAEDLAPLDGSIALRLGGILILLQDYGPAETQLKHAVQLSPTAPGPWQALAYLYSKTDRHELAADATSRARSLGG